MIVYMEPQGNIAEGYWRSSDMRQDFQCSNRWTETSAAYLVESVTTDNILTTLRTDEKIKSFYPYNRDPSEINKNLKIKNSSV